MKIYMAGAMMTCAERFWNKRLSLELIVLGHEIFLPQESESNEHSKFNARKIWKNDIKGIEWYDVVLAWIEGPDPDSGTSWELGYASGIGKINIAYTTDIRFQGAEDGRYDLNLMITKGVSEFLRFEPDDDPFEIAFNVDKLLKFMDQVTTNVKKYGTL